MDFTMPIPSLISGHTLLRLAVRRGGKNPGTPPWHHTVRLPMSNEKVAYVEIPLSEMDYDLLKDGAHLTRITAKKRWDRGEVALGTDRPRPWTWRDELQAVVSDGLMKMREDTYEYAALRRTRREPKKEARDDDQD